MGYTVQLENYSQSMGFERFCVAEPLIALIVVLLMGYGPILHRLFGLFCIVAAFLGTILLLSLS